MAFKSDLGEIAATIPADETINALYIELPLPVRGNVSIEAHAVDTDDALDAYSNQSEEKFKKSGLSVSVSNSLVDSAKSIDNLVDAAGNTSSTRMKGMAAVSGALKARALAQESKKALGALQSGNLKGVGNTRIQATVGSDKRQSNNESYNERSQASTIQAAGNLSLIATGGGKDSNININGSDIDVVGNALFKADNDFNVNGVAQKSYTRSSNKSSSFGIGGYMDSSGSGGITANASGAKGHGNSDATTYANSHINVGGTTTFDIGNDASIDSSVLNTNHLTGQVGGDLKVTSRQDTATYEGKQQNIGFNADFDLKGTNSSVSVNGGKMDISSDYAAVKEQAIIATQTSDLKVGGKGQFTGGALTTATPEDNHTIFKQGIKTQDITNYSRYKGDSISVGRLGGACDTQQLDIEELFNHSNLRVINPPLRIYGMMSIANPEPVQHSHASQDSCGYNRYECDNPIHHVCNAPKIDVAKYRARLFSDGSLRYVRFWQYDMRSSI